jgi:hypothetical protein
VTRTQAFGLLMLAAGVLLANGLNAVLDRWWAGTLCLGIAMALMVVVHFVVVRRWWRCE